MVKNDYKARADMAKADKEAMELAQKNVTLSGDSGCAIP
jgi:hypothetical protein